MFSENLQTEVLKVAVATGTVNDGAQRAMIFVSAAPLLSATKSGMVGTAKLT
jgi:translation initiation factor 6 (eIF-6)